MPVCLPVLHVQGSVHGDIHPSNVLFSASGRLKLVDLSSAATTGCMSPITGAAALAYMVRLALQALASSLLCFLGSSSPCQHLGLPPLLPVVEGTSTQPLAESSPVSKIQQFHQLLPCSGLGSSQMKPPHQLVCPRW